MLDGNLFETSPPNPSLGFVFMFYTPSYRSLRLKGTSCERGLSLLSGVAFSRREMGEGRDSPPRGRVARS